ncbi:MAG: cation-transporting P-type ATPase [Chloroflexi bacterium]|nr:cation-transporting P-type ATPase [Chloroflexota bacterium]
MSTAPIHSLRIPEVFTAMETSLEGISPVEAVSRRQLHGENALSEQAATPGWEKITRQTRHPFILLSVLAIAISLWERDYTLAVVIVLLTIINGIFSYWREHRAEQAIEKLRRILPAYAHLIRQGADVHIPSTEAVPGDLLILAEGDNIPADARVVEEYGLRVNNAALTGEAIPARKTADASLASGISDLERPNLIFAGTSVASGTGKAIVYSTGMLTQFGRIAHLTQTVQEQPSTFHKELARLSRIVTVIAMIVGAIVWAVVRFQPEVAHFFPEPLLLALGTIIAVTPEGLPATLTLSLAMAVQRLAGRGVLAKKLSIVETLGNVSVICTDKSGTLTQNQMTVREIWVAGSRLQVTGVGYEPKGEFVSGSKGSPPKDSLRALLEAAVCCNNARINAPSPEHPFWTCLGDQTEAAMKVAALKSGVREDFIEMDYPRIHEIPFDARRKSMSTIHQSRQGDMAFVKGAPREILGLCTSILLDGQPQPLTEALRTEILSANDKYARRALRVLAVARRLLPERMSFSAESVECDLTFLGLMAMMDPPRPEVEAAIQTCREAGIRIVMITGDYGLTAESLARRVGMVTGPNPLIITGSELDEMNDTALKNILDREIIFARMAPEHKLRLVAAYQARGDVVAVTGDGVNDAPALRKADVGVAMGVIGTDVAKEAADIILTNDNFGSIAAAIEEGRAIFNNIRKFITYIFSSNVPEVLPFLLTSAIGIPPALTVRQILAIDLGTDILPAIALGTEKPEPDLMSLPPRKRQTPLLDRGLLLRSFLWLGLIEAGLCYLGFLAVYVLSGNAALLNLPFLASVPWPHLLDIPGNLEATARTVFLAGVVTAQIGNAFACRTLTAHVTQMGWGSNKPLLAGAALSLVIIAGLVYLPPLQNAFDNQVFPAELWPFLFFYALVIYTFEWFRKRFVQLVEKKRPRGGKP